MLEGLFGEYHSSSAALGQQRPKVTKQPLTCDWSATSEALCDVNCHFARNTEVKNECNYTYVHAAMVGRVMLCGVGSMLFFDNSLVQLFVSSNFSVLTTYVYSCHTSLTVMPLSVYV